MVGSSFFAWKIKSAALVFVLDDFVPPLQGDEKNCRAGSDIQVQVDCGGSYT